MFNLSSLPIELENLIYEYYNPYKANYDEVMTELSFEIDDAYIFIERFFNDDQDWREEYSEDFFISIFHREHFQYYNLWTI